MPEGKQTECLTLSDSCGRREEGQELQTACLFPWKAAEKCLAGPFCGKEMPQLTSAIIDGHGLPGAVLERAA